jgi:hypothetical protein
MAETLAYSRNGEVIAEEVLNTYGTFLHPEGIPILDSYADTYALANGFRLLGEETSRTEFEALRQAITGEEIPLRLFSNPALLLPSLKQLARISIKPLTGCWELPVYGDGEDVYPEGSPQAGQPRARYGSLTVAGTGEQGKGRAHRTMLTIFRGPIPDDKFVDHVCNNKQCCWHRHLEAVEPGENTRRGREYRVYAAGQLPLLSLPRPETASALDRR